MTSSTGFVLSAAALLLATFAMLLRDLPLRALGRAGGALPDRPTLIALAVLVPMTAGAMYGFLGNWQSLRQPVGEVVPDAAHATGPADVQRMVQGLADKLARHPEDAKGWAMLARSWKVLGRYGESEQAFARAGTVVEGDPDLLAEYADVVAMRNNGRLSGKPMELVGKALALDPDHPTALWMAGTASYQRKDYAGARRSWEHLLKVLPDNSPDREVIQSNLKEIGMLSGDSDAAAATPGKASAQSPSAMPHAGTVRGTVKLSPELRSRVGPDDVLFVFARAASDDGKKMSMPLAVLRARAGDLPLDYVLDSANAMDPERTLAKAGLVTVEARISRHGDVKTQPGDLVGRVEGVKVGSRVNVLIDGIR